MKQKLFFIFLLASMMLGTSAFADEIIIGNGTYSTSYIPYNNRYKYSTTQSIYNVGKSGKITSIAYNVYQARTLNTDELKIYMGTTEKSYFSDYDDNSLPTDLMLVYTGTPVLGAQKGWETIQLDVPYEYNSNKKLMVVVCRKSDSKQSNLYYNCTNNSQTCRYRGGDNEAYSDVSNSELSYYSSSDLPNITLEIDTTPFESETFTLDGITYETQLGYQAKVLDIQDSQEIIIPSSVKHGDKTLKVTSITPGILDDCVSVSLPIEYNFGSNTTLKKLYIDEGVTYFSGYKDCTALEDISLPGSLEEISSFQKCTSLKTVAFRYGPTKLKGLQSSQWSSATFENCQLDSIYVDREFDFTFSRDPNPFSYNVSIRTNTRCSI